MLVNYICMCNPSRCSFMHAHTSSVLVLRHNSVFYWQSARKVSLEMVARRSVSVGLWEIVIHSLDAVYVVWDGMDLLVKRPVLLEGLAPVVYIHASVRTVHRVTL